MEEFGRKAFKAKLSCSVFDPYIRKFNKEYKPSGALANVLHVLQKLTGAAKTFKAEF